LYVNAENRNRSVGVKRPGQGRVLGAALPQAERDLLAFGRDPERDDVRAVGDLQAVEHHHRQPARHPTGAT
jgi:hypothetical protein